MSTNIDRSLDEIIKEQKKLKKKANQNIQKGQKRGKQQQQLQKKQQGKTVTRRGKLQLKGKQGAGQNKNNNQWRRQAGNNVAKNKVAGNRGKVGGARVLANRLKNKQGSFRKSKQIVSKAKQLQANQRTKNRQNRQAQQNDARQNIINKRRGIQGNQFQKNQNPRNLNKARLFNNRRRQRNGNTAPQLTVAINNPRVRLNRNPHWKQNSGMLEGQNRRRRWQGQARGNATLSETKTHDLRISVPNNLHQPPVLRPKPVPFSYNPPISYSLGTTSTTLNDRFSSAPQRGVRTIVVD